MKIQKQEICEICGNVTSEAKEITYGIVIDTVLVAEFDNEKIRDKCFVKIFEQKGYLVEVETSIKSGFKVICLR